MNEIQMTQLYSAFTPTRPARCKFDEYFLCLTKKKMNNNGLALIRNVL